MLQKGLDIYTGARLSHSITGPEKALALALALDDFQMLVLTDEGLGFQVLLLQHTPKKRKK